jgi:hypothetical protein
VADEPVELLPPQPIRTAAHVADIERTTTLARWFDEAVGRDIDRPAFHAAAPAPAPGPGPRRQELQVFRQLWLPVDEVVTYLAASPARPTCRRRPRLECAFADLRRPPDRPLWTAEGDLRPGWGLAGIRVRLSIYGLAGPRTVLDLVPLMARGSFRSRRFARAGMGALEALREEIRRAMPERVHAGST